MKVVTVEQMRAIEAASDASGHTYAAMMERAGRAVAEALMSRVEIKGKRVLVLVGPGNNGGDGLVAAYYLAQAGAEVACYLSRPRDPRQDANLRRLQEKGIFLTVAETDEGYSTLRRLAAGADVVIDGLLGTGSTPPVRGTVAEVLKTVAEVLRRRGQRPAPDLQSVGALHPRPSRPAPGSSLSMAPAGWTSTRVRWTRTR